MNAYSYDRNGVFVRECACQRDPVRSAREGRACFLVPANATTVAPPDFDPETEFARWDGTAWQVEAIPPAPDPAELPEPEPTEVERLRADVDYLALMTGVEL